MKQLSRVQLFATPWTVAHQVPPFMEFSRQEYWSGLPFPSPGDLPDPGIKPRSLELQADALLSEPPRNCRHEIKRCLLLGRKPMTNLDSILKNRDFTLPTKFHLVKVMVFPGVMYGLRVGPERKLSTEKLMLLNCGVGEDS